MIVKATAVSALRENVAKSDLMSEQGANFTWHQRVATFLRNSTKGLWCAVLAKRELAMFGSAKAPVLNHDCAHSVKQGQRMLTLLSQKPMAD